MGIPQKLFCRNPCRFLPHCTWRNSCFNILNWGPDPIQLSSDDATKVHPQGMGTNIYLLHGCLPWDRTQRVPRWPGWISWTTSCPLSRILSLQEGHTQTEYHPFHRYPSAQALSPELESLFIWKRILFLFHLLAEGCFLLGRSRLLDPHSLQEALEAALHYGLTKGKPGRSVCQFHVPLTAWWQGKGRQLAL